MAILFGNHHQGNAKSDWTATQGAAFQLAVWEIVYENTQAAGTNFNGTYNVTSTNPLHGNFYVTGGVSTTVLNLANSCVGPDRVDPLTCPRCSAQMRIVSVTTTHTVIDRILRHVRKAGKDDLWGARAPPAA